MKMREGEADQKAPAMAAKAPQMRPMPAGSTINGSQMKARCCSGFTRKGIAVQCMLTRKKPEPNAQPRKKTALPQRRSPRAPSIIQTSAGNERASTALK